MDAYDDCLDAIKKMGNCPMTLAMQNHKVLGSSRTVLDWVRATLLDLEVEINARKKNMTDDRDICERLECPSYDGAIYMRQDAAKEIRRLREYSSKQALDIVALGQEVGRLREALEKIAALDVPPSVMTRYREDEQPSEDDLCPHLLPMSEDCPDCIADYARAALAGKEEK